LELLQKHAARFNNAITPENAGEKLWLRVERQTLRRLPLSGAVLFTIRSYVYLLAAVVERRSMERRAAARAAAESAAGAAIAQQLSDAIQALTPDMQKYKNLLPFRQALLAYLSDRTRFDLLMAADFVDAG